MPHQTSDHPALDFAAYQRTGSRKSWVDVTDGRWPNLGPGWHPVEPFADDPGILFRWSRKTAAVYLYNNYGPAVLRMQVLGRGFRVKRPRVFHVSVNARPPVRFELESDDWEEVSLQYLGRPGPMEVRIGVDETWSPHEVFHNGDHRQLGIAVRRLDLRPAMAETDGLDQISVVIPTYNRIEKLRQVLAALEAQSVDPERFEVIVIDDGSTDATGRTMAAYVTSAPLDVRYYKQENKLQGAARNWGIQLARKPLVAFIGDDIIPHRDFLRQHLDSHRTHNRYGDVVVVGYTTWAAGNRVTPFMEFIGERGPQFGYACFNGNGPLSFDCFYTSNISMPRKMLQELEYVFDEDFNTYGWEDIELGYRLERNGMRLLYNPRATAYHDHPTDVRAFCRRQFLVGRGSRIFVRKHPHLETMLGSLDRERNRLRNRFVWKTLETAVAILDRRLAVGFSPLLYHAILSRNYAEGVVAEATANGSGNGQRPTAGVAWPARVAAAAEADRPRPARENPAAVPVHAAGGSQQNPHVFFYVTSQGNEFMTEIAEAFQEGFAGLGVRASLRVDELPPADDADNLHVLAAPHEIIPLLLERKLEGKALRDVLANCCLLNVEQPGSIWFEIVAASAAKARGIFDINRLGVQEFRRRGVHAWYTPLGYRPSLEQYPGCEHERKDIDLLFLGHHFEKRELFLARNADVLQKYRCHLTLINVNKPLKTTTSGYYAGDRLKQLLRRSKILINVHSTDRNYFEWQRVLWCMAHRCLVVSELSRDTQPLVDREHLVLAPVEKLAEQCEQYLADEALRSKVTEQAYQFVRGELRIENACRTMLQAWRRDPHQAEPAGSPMPETELPGVSPPTDTRNDDPTAHAARELRRRVWARCRQAVYCRPALREMYFRVRALHGRMRRACDEKAPPDVEAERRALLERLQRQRASAAGDRSGPRAFFPNAGYQHTSRPAVSVIVTVHNDARYVTECLESVAASRRDRLPGGLEVLVVDDGSTDASIRVVRRWLRRSDVPACLVQKPLNTGLASSRNLGLALARAPLVFVLDADDLVYPGCLQRLRETITSCGSAAAYAAIKRFDGRTGSALGLLSYNAWDVERLIEGPYLDSMAMFDREKVLAVGGYSEELLEHGIGLEGYDLWLKLAQAGEWAAFRPEILSAHREHPACMAHKQSRYHAALAAHFREKFADLLRRYSMEETQFTCPEALEGAQWTTERRRAA
ncbi:MAG: glycosyltransferase [Pirellulales bacterium]|nr:glycosyltransferase [Pirellulales bacterium]